MNVKPIRTKADYEAALDRISELMDARAGTPEGTELDVLADLVELYESKNVPMGFPSPVAAIEFRMEQAGLSARDLVPFIGSRAKVSEVLSGKRQITMTMARALHEHLGIPSDVLLKGSSVGTEESEIDWAKFPVAKMMKLKWLPKRPRVAQHAEEIMRGLMHRAGRTSLVVEAMYRKNDHARANAKADSFALNAWCLQLLALASERKLPKEYKPETVTPDFLSQVAKLSWSENGPLLAKEFLEKNGIHLIILEHLPKTHLDGAALKLADGTPVIGLTLRYDRIDNFWFCLLHELAHVGRHFENAPDVGFVDDLTLRDSEGASRDSREDEADQWAEEACIPRSIWENSDVRFHPTPIGVINLASALQIHPAIVAGRVRHQFRNYRLLSHFVGTGEVRKHFKSHDMSH
ncbi:transcriptional regulator [Bradyrhizobium sp. CCBAU 51753]|uniref:transcriptional regulator n=1 Tax=Bradyrhizobium sp. CCBAU 51753 TaxID=1325100 RepID=UPI00188D081B|nr:transcriptional regulator [Bradyrhizobium sp. CCBAU 51753]